MEIGHCVGHRSARLGLSAGLNFRANDARGEPRRSKGAWGSDAAGNSMKTWPKISSQTAFRYPALAGHTLSPSAPHPQRQPMSVKTVVSGRVGVAMQAVKVAIHTQHRHHHHRKLAEQRPYFHDGRSKKVAILAQAILAQTILVHHRRLGEDFPGPYASFKAGKQRKI